MHVQIWKSKSSCFEKFQLSSAKSLLEVSMLQHFPVPKPHTCSCWDVQFAIFCCVSTIYFLYLPSLKLTLRVYPWKWVGWVRWFISFWVSAYFQGRFAVSFRSLDFTSPVKMCNFSFSHTNPNTFVTVSIMVKWHHIIFILNKHPAVVIKSFHCMI